MCGMGVEAFMPPHCFQMTGDLFFHRVLDKRQLVKDLSGIARDPTPEAIAEGVDKIGRNVDQATKDRGFPVIAIAMLVENCIYHMFTRDDLRYAVDTQAIKFSTNYLDYIKEHQG